MDRVLVHPATAAWLRDRPSSLTARIRNDLDDAGRNPWQYLIPLADQRTYCLHLGNRHRAEVDWDKARGQLYVLWISDRDDFYE